MSIHNNLSYRKAKSGTNCLFKIGILSAIEPVKNMHFIFITNSNSCVFNNNRNRIEIFWGKDKKKWDKSLLDKFFRDKNVYITFDVDGFDASIMPATGTPEPGGMLWEDVLPIIKKVCQVSNVVGADINELAPIKNFDSYNFLVAKLAYKILAYTFEFKH